MDLRALIWDMVQCETMPTLIKAFTLSNAGYAPTNGTYRLEGKKNGKDLYFKDGDRKRWVCWSSMSSAWICDQSGSAPYIQYNATNNGTHLALDGLWKQYQMSGINPPPVLTILESVEDGNTSKTSSNMSAPTKPVDSFELSGAAFVEVNGVYRREGSYQGKTLYSKVGDSAHWICWSAQAGCWICDKNGSAPYMLKTSSLNGDDFPRSGEWCEYQVSGIMPGPMITYDVDAARQAPPVTKPQPTAPTTKQNTKVDSFELRGAGNSYYNARFYRNGTKNGKTWYRKLDDPAHYVCWSAYSNFWICDRSGPAPYKLEGFTLNGDDFPLNGEWKKYESSYQAPPPKTYYDLNPTPNNTQASSATQNEKPKDAETTKKEEVVNPNTASASAGAAAAAPVTPSVPVQQVEPTKQATNEVASSPPPEIISQKEEPVVKKSEDDDEQTARDKKEEETKTATKAAITEALKYGKKEWLRSKIMIVGEGRAGKSALANNIIGKPFSETQSTVGINQLTCDVQYASSRRGNQSEQSKWRDYKKPEKMFESAVANLVQDYHNLSLTTKIAENKEDIVSYMLQQQQQQQQELQEEEESSYTNAVVGGVGGAGDAAVDPAVVAVSGGAPQSSYVQQLPVVTNSTTTTSDPAVPTTTSQQNQAALPPIPTTSTTTSSLPLVPTGTTHADSLVDDDVLMQCLSDAVETQSDLIISVFDYGGQSVFNVIHHLFLTRHGVYLLAFNMEWLLHHAEERHRCLSYLRFWMNSIVLHTYNPSEGTTAPIILVGTHKDTVSQPVDHETISLLLTETFSKSIAWPSVLDNQYGKGTKGTTSFCFFPIDNRQGREDTTMQTLLTVIETTLDEQPFTHREVPLPWLKAWDTIESLHLKSVPWSQLETVWQQCGIPSYEQTCFLSFFHEMGVIMWHDEWSLRDVVIVDPIAYLVIPATLIICRHKPDAQDATHHVDEVHKLCQRKYADEWHDLLESGILHEVLLPILWKQYRIHQTQLIALMIKFGLLVPLLSTSSSSSFSPTVGNRGGSAKQPRRYLVPALVPKIPIPHPPMTFSASSATGSYNTCYLIFTTSAKFSSYATISQQDLLDYGFLPSGLFHRIVGRAVLWCQETARKNTFRLDQLSLFQDMAILRFGSQQFRLTVYPHTHTIRLDIEGKSPLALHDRLLEQIRSVMQECMPLLQCFSAVMFTADYPATSSHDEESRLTKFFLRSESADQPPQAAIGAEEVQGMLLIPIEEIRRVSASKSVLCRRGVGSKLLNDVELTSTYAAWIVSLDTLLPYYDFFLSYRWGEYDDVVVNALFDTFTNYTIGIDHHAIHCFLDKKRLQKGRNYRSDFVDSLIHTTVLMPIVSTDALQKLLHHTPQTIDNLLLEWIVALRLYNTKTSRLQRIYPVFFGTRIPATSATPKEEEGSNDHHMKERIQNLFAEQILESLPDIVPTATLMHARELWNSLICGHAHVVTTSNLWIEETSPFLQQTLRSIVEEFVTMLGCATWEIQAHTNTLIADIADQAMDILLSVDAEATQFAEAQSLLPLQQSYPIPIAVPSATEVVNVAIVSPSPVTNKKDTSDGDRFADAWALLHDANKMTSGSLEAMAELLNTLGVEESGDLEELEDEHIQQMAALLKAIPKKKFLKAFTK